MRQECPECRTVTGGNAAYCGSCGYVFKFKVDAVRLAVGKAKPTKYYAVAAAIGVALAAVLFLLFRFR